MRTRRELRQQRKARIRLIRAEPQAQSRRFRHVSHGLRHVVLHLLHISLGTKLDIEKNGGARSSRGDGKSRITEVRWRNNRDPKHENET